MHLFGRYHCDWHFHFSVTIVCHVTKQTSMLIWVTVYCFNLIWNVSVIACSSLESIWASEETLSDSDHQSIQQTTCVCCGDVQRTPKVGLECPCVGTLALLWCHWILTLRLNWRWSMLTFLTLTRESLSTELTVDHQQTSLFSYWITNLLIVVLLYRMN